MVGGFGNRLRREGQGQQLLHRHAGLDPLRFSIVVFLLAVASFTLLAPATAATSLQKEDASRIIAADLAGDPALTLVVLTKDGEAWKVADWVAQLGGVVRFRDDAISYLNVAIPPSALRDVLGHPSIEAVTVDEHWNLLGAYVNDVTDGAGDTAALALDNAASSALPTSTDPLKNPYDILVDLAAKTWRDDNPTYDGRGVVIAQVEHGPDFLAPELQTALDSNGREIPKYLDVIAHFDPEPSLKADPSPIEGGTIWVRLDAGSNSSPEKLPVEAGSDLRAGTLKIPNIYLKNIAIRGTSPTGAATDFPILWSESRKLLWVDEDRDGDFRDETPVPEYSARGQFGTFGVDDPATRRRDTLGYVVKKEGKWVSLILGAGPHATEVSGSAAGRAGRLGRIDGVAPGAQLLLVHYGTTTSSFARALITAFDDPRSDVVLVEGKLPPASIHHINDGRYTLALLIQRLIERYKKPCVVTGDNRYALGSVTDISAPDALVVGAWESRNASLINKGFYAAREINLHIVGAEGPTAEGGLKPDLLAPVLALVPSTGFEEGDRRPGLYELPPGYHVMGGTSQAGPIGAGAVALLVSAAKQAGLAHDYAAINHALKASAHFVSDFAAHQQGAGLIQVASAWEQMKASANKPWAAFRTQAPVRTATSDLLHSPGNGSGLYEREGWRLGQDETRQVQVTRLSGRKRDSEYELAWLGNEGGTFAAPSKVRLPLRKATSIPIRIHPNSLGAHSAILMLRRAGSGRAEQHMLFTVVVPADLSKANDFSVEQKFTVDAPGRHSAFFRVPKGAGALTFEITQGNPKLYMDLRTPENYVTRQIFVAPDPLTGANTVSVEFPSPGVWQLAFSNFTGTEFNVETRDKPSKPTQVNLKVYARGVALTPQADGSIRVKNEYAPLEGGVVSSELGRVHRRTVEMLGLESQQFDIMVEPGAELLIAGAQARNSAFDVDLYLYDCTSGTCQLTPSRSGKTHGSEERVVVEKPEPGRWRAVISSLATAGSSSVDSFDVVTHSKFGTLVTNDSILARDAGARWTLTQRPIVLTDDSVDLAAVLFLQSRAVQTIFLERQPLLSRRRQTVPLGLTVQDLGSGSVGIASPSRH